MKAFDCSHPSHEDIHFVGEDNAQLVEQIKQHRDEHHTEVTDEQIETMVSSGAYEE